MLIPKADNEEVRLHLANSLHRRTPDVSLPPTSFLNRCIHTFTTRVWPLIPIIHLPTFDPSRTHPLLLLSICSLGALAGGSESAVRYSERLFEGVRKAILVSSMTFQAGEQSTLEMLQAATIGQTYAFLSGKPAHLLTARVYHSSLCAAVQSLHTQQVQSKSRVSYHQPDQLSWPQWVREESIIRLLITIYIHNAEIAATTRQSASMRSDPWRLPLAAPDSIFLAKCPDVWADMRSYTPRTQVESHSIFSTCAGLACLSAEISHCKTGPFARLEDHTEEIRASLVAWLEQYPIPSATEASMRVMVLMLWHSCFLVLLSDVDAVERLCNGDNENDISNATVEALTRWRDPGTAARCATHALLILQLLKRLHIGDVPILHVARASWHAALVLAAYACYAPESGSVACDFSTSTCPELDAVRKLNVLGESDWIVVSRNMGSTGCKASAFMISSLLRSLSPWGDAKYYAVDVDKLLGFIEP